MTFRKIDYKIYHGKIRETANNYFINVVVRVKIRNVINMTNTADKIMFEMINCNVKINFACSWPALFCPVPHKMR